jgi:hypothetical protein
VRGDLVARVKGVLDGIGIVIDAAYGLLDAL